MSAYLEELGDVVRDAEGRIWLFADNTVVNGWTPVTNAPEDNEPAEFGEVPQPVTLLVRDGQVVTRVVDLVFDGAPSHEGGRFVETEDLDGHGVRLGDWVDLGRGGYWALRIEVPA